MSVKPSPSSIIWQVLRQKPLAEPAASFAGKTVLITGASSGLGLAAATAFARLGAARLVLGVRDLEAGRAAARQAAAAAAAAPGQREEVQPCATEVWQLDMSSHASVAAFAARAAADLDRLDVAVLNAGVYAAGARRSQHGWETMLQVNALSTALLAVLLLPKLAASGSSGPAVLQFVTSRRAEAVRVPAGEEQGQNLLGRWNGTAATTGAFRPSEQYRVSKFVAMCAMKKLAALVDPAEVTVTAVCPGAVATNLGREWTGPVAAVVKALASALFLRPPEYAARTVVGAAALGSEAGGKFWYDDELHDLPNLAGEEGQKLVNKIWAELVDVLSREVPAVNDLLKTLPGP